MMSPDDELELDLDLDAALDDAALAAAVGARLGVAPAALPPLEIRRRAIDARRHRVRLHLTVGPRPAVAPALGGPATRAAPAAAVAASSIDVYGVSDELDAAIERDDDAGVEAALAQLDAAWADWRALAMSLRAIFVARDRHPARAVQIADFVLGRPDPSPEEAPELHDEWLGGLLNATAACTRLADGGSEACARVVARAIEQGPVQPALFHNLACYMTLRGDRARALELVEAAARHGYEDLAELLADDELAALRDGGALEAAIARGQAAADEAP